MAIDLDSATNDMGINMGSPSALDDLGSFSISAWIKPASWGEGSFGRIAQKGTGTNGWIFYVDDINATETISFIRFRFITNTQIIGGDNEISSNVWQHVAVTYESSGAKIYVNGAEISYTSNIAGSAGEQTDFLDDFYWGNRDGLGRGFDGLMEDCRVYTRVLSASEISQIAAARGRDSIWQGKLVHLPMKEKSPGTSLSTDPVKDITNNKLNGVSEYTGTQAAEGTIRSRGRRCA
jgi:hypothetical protein